MIAWRVHTKSYYRGKKLMGSVYAFTKKKTALWYQKKYMKGKGDIIKIYGYFGRKHKDHKDQRIFEWAVILTLALLIGRV